jgi:hypothetical protein
MAHHVGMRALGVCFVLTLSACDRASRREQRASRATATSRAAHAGNARDVWANSLFLDTLDGPVASCGLTHAFRFPNPGAVLDDYIASDTTGTYGDLDDLLCPDWPQGSDVVTVVTTTTVRPLRLALDSAWFVVERKRVGEISATGTSGVGMVLQSMVGVEPDTTLLVRTAYGWRIAAPTWPGMHVSPRAALRLYPGLSPGARDSLRGLMESG